MRVLYESELRGAAISLPAGVRVWIDRALRSGWFEIGPYAYQGDDGTLCPIAAAGKMAGVWSDGAIAAGNPEWGTPEAPSDPVEDFAAYFDLCVQERGLAEVVELVQDALAEGNAGDRRAA